MKECSFDIEFITPLFMSGADQQDVELRAPSIKGVMRYWFRAMMGKILNDDFCRLREIEGDLFGNTKDEKSATASKFGIETRLLDMKNAHFDFIQQRGEFAGLRYLGFPFYPPKKSAQARPAISVHSKCRSNFILRQTCSDVEAQVIIATFWLLANLGNIGSRSRRGFGSFRVINQAKDIFGFNFKIPPEIKDVPGYLKNGIQQAEKIFNDFATHYPKINGHKSDPDALPQFDSFSKWSGLVLTSANWTDWSQALDSIGSSLRKFRLEQADMPGRPTANRPGYSSKPKQIAPTQDYVRVVRGFLQGKQQPPEADFVHDIFGLPILYKPYKSNLVATLKFEINGESGERRASPLIIHPILSEKQYGILVHLFESQFIPSGAREMLISGNNKLPIIKADYSILKKDFFSFLKNQYKSYPI